MADVNVIVDAGVTPVGNNATGNGVAEDTAAWFENRKKNGLEAHSKAAAPNPPASDKPGAPEAPAANDGAKPGGEPNGTAKPDDKKPLTPLEKANHAWSSKFGRESAKRKAAEEAAGAAKAEVARLQAEQQKLRGQLQQFSGQPLDRSKYPTEGEYLQAGMTRTAQEVNMRTQDAQYDQAIGQVSQQAQAQAWAAGAQAISQVLPDWQQKVGGAQAVQLTPQSVQDIVSSDLGHELAYFLADHPEAAAALNQTMHPAQRLRLLARLEMHAEDYVNHVASQGQVQPAASAPAQAPAPQPVPAPAPPAPTLVATAPTGPSGHVAPATAATMSMEDYFKLRKQGKFR